MADRSDDLSERSDFDRYFTVLEPLFDANQYMRVDRLFEYVCCLVRAGGIEAKDSDPISETNALVDDLAKLSQQSLDFDQFAHPARTRSRLALIAYCHVVEADFFYRVLASLSKLRGGSKYDMNPFRGLAKNRGTRVLPPTLSKKMGRVSELSAAVGIDTKALFDEVFFPDIRNAVFHADYALSDTEFRMLGGWHKAPEGYLSQTIPFEQLDSIITRAFAFYSAVLALHDRARRQLIDFEAKIVPFDPHYKGLLELLFEEGALAGFRAYWPNGSISEFSRLHTGSSAVNVVFEGDGSINFMVGLYAPKSRRSDFSPLVESGTPPVYRPAPGRTTAPHWPEDLRPYKAEEPA